MTISTVEAPNTTVPTIAELIPLFNYTKKKLGINIIDFTSIDEFIEEVMKHLPAKQLKRALAAADGILDTEIKAELHRREV